MSSWAQAVFARTPPPLRWRAVAVQHRRHEPELRRIHELMPAGGVAVDVGAWWGPWTYWLSRRAAHVYAIEPVEHLAAFLRKVSPATVTVVEGAASDAAGDAVLFLPDRGVGSEGRATMHDSGAGADTQPVVVHGVRLDDLDLPRVDLVKIDVEGHELAVLAGATELFERSKPVLVIELEQRFHTRPFAEIVADIEAMGYEGSFLDGSRWCPISEFDVQRMQIALEQEASTATYGSLRSSTRAYKNNFVFRPV